MRSLRPSDKFYQHMQNIAYISGWLRMITSEHFCIQQTRNENQMIRIFLRENMELPSWANEEWIPVKATCRVYGVLDKTGRRAITLSLLALDRANVLDLPPAEAWGRDLPPGVPQSTFTPTEFGMRFSKTSNQTFLAGFVGAIMREPVSQFTDKRGVIILLQQHSNIDRAIPIRYRGKFCEVVRSRCRVGTSLAIVGRYRVKTIPDSSQPVRPDGFQPIITSTFVEIDDVPLLATFETILSIPAWAASLGANAGIEKQIESSHA